MNMSNGHRMFITHIYRQHRNPETQKKNLTTSKFRYETFYYLWVKRFFDIRRERHNFFILTFLSAPNHVWHLPQGHWPGFGEPRKSTVFFRPRTQLTDFSQISAHVSGAWRHSHPLVTIPIWDFYCDISEWHVCSARAGTPALMFAPN